MKTGILAVALIAALAFVGSDAQKAEAGTPFFVQIGGPRGGISIGSGYGGYGSYLGNTGYRRLPDYPFGVTRGYSAYRVPRTRYYDYGHGGGGYRHGVYGHGGYGGGGYGGRGCYR